MPPNEIRLRLGTRGSALARWQADWVTNQLQAAGVVVEQVMITTKGDVTSGAISEIGGQGLFTRELDEARGQAVLASFPGKIKRIDGNAMAAESGAGIKRREPKGLGLGGFDYLPDVDAHFVINKLQFIDEGDVHAAINILKQLRSLGDAAGGNWHERLDGGAVNGLGFFQTSGRVAADHLGDTPDAVLSIGRIFAFWRIGEVKISSRLETAARLENRPQLVLSGAGIGGGL